MQQYPDENTSNSFLSDKNEKYSLILYNDSYNNIDFVIESLIKVCMHSTEQATQCALIAHYKGKSVIKKGIYTLLKPLKDSLNKRGINTGIE